MKEKELQYLSRGQLHDIIREQGEVISHLMDKLRTIEGRSTILGEPYEIWDPSKRTLKDVLDELYMGSKVTGNHNTNSNTNRGSEMEDMHIQFLSEGKPHGNIHKRDDLMQQLKSDKHILEEDSVMSKGSFALRSKDNLTLRDVMGESDITDKLFEQRTKQLKDIIDELGIDFIIVDNVAYTQGSLD